jgi:uncharacterized protein involved in exopolysaccharide biosynthesis
MTSNDEISVIDIWRVLVRSKILILSVAASVLLIAVAYAMLATPVYRAQVLLMAAESDQGQSVLSSLPSQLGGLASLAGVRANDNKLKTEAIATLKSRAFLEAFIRDMNLLPVLYSDRWDEEADDWDVDDSDEIPTVGAAYDVFMDKILTVTEGAEESLVTLAIETTERQRADVWANTLVSRLNELLRQRSIREAEKSIEYLNNELSQTSVVEIQQAIFRLIESQVQKIMLANVREEFAFRVIDPAKVPEPGKFIKPKRMLVVAGGLIGGLLAGLFLAFFVHSYQLYRADESQ